MNVWNRLSCHEFGTKKKPELPHGLETETLSFCALKHNHLATVKFVVNQAINIFMRVMYPARISSVVKENESIE